MSISMNANAILISLFAAIYSIPVHTVNAYPAMKDWNQMIQDTTKPTASCQTNTPTVKMPLSGCVNIFAKDLNNGSTDDVTPADRLKFYFNGDRSRSFVTIRCSDFDAANATDSLKVNVELWVEDEAGNTDLCKTVITIKDSSIVCPAVNNKLAQVTGSIRTRKGLPVPANYSFANNTDYASDFQYSLLPGLYQVCPRSDENPAEGITTSDIVRIQRQILGLDQFTNSYALLAGDVNQSNNLTNADVAEIRKLILGLIPRFSKVPSWIFLPRDSVFPTNAFPSVTYFKNYCKQFSVGAITKVNLEFIAVKMGDVTDNSAGHNVNKIISRAQIPFLEYEHHELENNLLKTDFKLSQLDNPAGLQFTLHFNPNDCEFIRIENGNITLENDQYALQDLAKGKIHFAWDRNPMDNNKLDRSTLFSIIWKKKSTESPNLALDRNQIKALYIDQDLNESDLYLINRHQGILSTINIFPDYFSRCIHLDGYLNDNTDANISVCDITGRLQLLKNITLHKGDIRETFKLDELQTTGLCLIRIQCGNEMRIVKYLNTR